MSIVGALLLYLVHLYQFEKDHWCSLTVFPIRVRLHAAS